MVAHIPGNKDFQIIEKEQHLFHYECTHKVNVPLIQQILTLKCLFMTIFENKFHKICIDMN